MRHLLLAIAMLGCGSTPPKSPANSTGSIAPPVSASPKDEAALRERLCKRAAALSELGCPPFDQLDPRLLESCGVVSSFQMAGMDRCLDETTCSALKSCFTLTRMLADPPRYSGPTRACSLPADHDDLAMPAGFSAEEIAQSHGATAKTFADALSSKDHPIEVCGFPAAEAWMMHRTCKDGSHPLASRTDAARARVDNVGPGGRCGRIIDQYAAECPEHTYDVYIDSYRCPQ